MKQTIIILAMFFVSTLTFAQKMNTKDLEQRIAVLEDKIAIKQVVDEFSNLADTKEIDKQVLLFTENGVVESFSNGERSSTLKGREQLEQAFSAFLSRFHTVYHLNGQQTIQLQGEAATTTSYCTVTLVGEQEGKQMKTTLLTIYNDSLVKQNGKWLIAHRKSNFVRREVEEVR